MRERERKRERERVRERVGEREREKEEDKKQGREIGPGNTRNNSWYSCVWADDSEGDTHTHEARMEVVGTLICCNGNLSTPT